MIEITLLFFLKMHLNLSNYIMKCLFNYMKFSFFFKCILCSRMVQIPTKKKLTFLLVNQYYGVFKVYYEKCEGSISKVSCNKMKVAHLLNKLKLFVFCVCCCHFLN